MHLLKTNLILGILVCVFYTSYSQCPQCTPDESCIPEILFPTLCPEILPDGTAGEEYEEVITFFMPPELEDPESGIIVDLIQIVVTNATGLPFGLDFELSSEDNTYYPSEGEMFGCASTCGIPIIAGDYLVTIYVTATVTVLGFEQEVLQNFSLPLTILPGEGGTASFTWDNTAACEELEVNFEALIDGSPGQTDYNWDFGNGNDGDEQLPPTQSYTGEGEYTVSLETTISDFVLENVTLTSMNQNWLGDVEELTTFSNPDPYFVITDGNQIAVYTSSTVDDVLSAFWENIDLLLTNPPYSISFYDEDFISENDFLGSFDFPLETGAYNFSGDGTSGIIQIGLQTGDTFYDEQVFSVFPLPDSDLQIGELGNELYFADTLLSEYLWLFNGDTIPNAIDSLLVLEEFGVYSCIITNIYGCSSLSDEFIFCPDPEIFFDPFGNTLSIDGPYNSYTWFYNGIEIEGETGNTIDASEPGNYSVTVTTSFGCEGSSNVYTVETGIEESEITNWSIYPNPSSGLVYLTLGDIADGLLLTVSDPLGKTLISMPLRSSSQILDLNEFSAGLYLITLSSANRTSTHRVILK